MVRERWEWPDLETRVSTRVGDGKNLQPALVTGALWGCPLWVLHHTCLLSAPTLSQLRAWWPCPGKPAGLGESQVAPLSPLNATPAHFPKCQSRRAKLKEYVCPLRDGDHVKCHRSAVLPRLLNIAVSFGKSLRRKSWGAS